MIEVIEPGRLATIQDLGRPGYREWGVPPGGAFDRGSADLANALVGNPPSCAVLELTLKGGVYRAAGGLAAERDYRDPPGGRARGEQAGPGEVGRHEDVIRGRQLAVLAAVP